MEKIKLVSFIEESNRIEGIVRSITSAQTGREIEAHRHFLSLSNIRVSDLVAFVSIVQPDAVLRRQVGQNVRVGSHIAPLGGPKIETELETILGLMRDYGAYRTHVEYEQLHPFTDGNGRSGRVLWLWMMKEAPLGFLHQFYYQTLNASR